MMTRVPSPFGDLNCVTQPSQKKKERKKENDKNVEQPELQYATGKSANGYLQFNKYTLCIY